MLLNSTIQFKEKKNKHLKKKQSSPVYWHLNSQSFSANLDSQIGQNNKKSLKLKPFHNSKILTKELKNLLFQNFYLAKVNTGFNQTKLLGFSCFPISSLGKSANQNQEFYKRQKIINELASFFKNQNYKIQKNRKDHYFLSSKNKINNFLKITLFYEIKQFYWKPLFFSHPNQNLLFPSKGKQKKELFAKVNNFNKVDKNFFSFSFAFIEELLVPLIKLPINIPLIYKSFYTKGIERRKNGKTKKLFNNKKVKVYNQSLKKKNVYIQMDLFDLRKPSYQENGAKKIQLIQNDVVKAYSNPFNVSTISGFLLSSKEHKISLLKKRKKNLSFDSGTGFLKKKYNLLFFFNTAIFFDTRNSVSVFCNIFLFHSFCSFLVYCQIYLFILEPKHENDFPQDLFGYRLGRGNYVTIQKLSFLLATYSFLFNYSTFSSNKKRGFISLTKPFLFFSKDALLKDLAHLILNVYTNSLFPNPLSKGGYFIPLLSQKSLMINKFNRFFPQNLGNQVLKTLPLTLLNLDSHCNLVVNTLIQKNNKHLLMGWYKLNLANVYLMVFSFFLQNQVNSIHFQNEDQYQSNFSFKTNKIFNPKSVLKLKMKKNFFSLETLYAKKTLFFGKLKRFVFFLQLLNNFYNVVLFEKNSQKGLNNIVFLDLQNIKKKPNNVFFSVTLIKTKSQFFNNFNYLNLSEKAIEYTLIRFFLNLTFIGPFVQGKTLLQPGNSVGNFSFLIDKVRIPLFIEQSGSIYETRVAKSQFNRELFIFKLLTKLIYSILFNKNSLMALKGFLYLRESDLIQNQKQINNSGYFMVKYLKYKHSNMNITNQIDRKQKKLLLSANFCLYKSCCLQGGRKTHIFLTTIDSFRFYWPFFKKANKDIYWNLKKKFAPQIFNQKQIRIRFKYGLLNQKNYFLFVNLTNFLIQFQNRFFLCSSLFFLLKEITFMIQDSLLNNYLFIPKKTFSQTEHVLQRVQNFRPFLINEKSFLLKEFRESKQAYLPKLMFKLKFYNLLHRSFFKKSLCHGYLPFLFEATSNQVTGFVNQTMIFFSPLEIKGNNIMNLLIFSQKKSISLYYKGDFFVFQLKLKKAYLEKSKIFSNNFKTTFLCQSQTSLDFIGYSIFNSYFSIIQSILKITNNPSNSIIIRFSFSLSKTIDLFFFQFYFKKKELKLNQILVNLLYKKIVFYADLNYLFISKKVLVKIVINDKNNSYKDAKGLFFLNQILQLLGKESNQNSALRFNTILAKFQRFILFNKFFKLKKQKDEKLWRKKILKLGCYRTILIPKKIKLTDHLRLIKYIIQTNNLFSSFQLIQKISPLIRSWCYYYKLISSEVSNDYFLNNLFNDLQKRPGLSVAHRATIKKSLNNWPRDKSLQLHSDFSFMDFIVMKLLWKWIISLLGEKDPLFLGEQNRLRHPNKITNFLSRLFVLRKQKNLTFFPNLILEKRTLYFSLQKKANFLRTKGLVSNIKKRNQNWIFVTSRHQRFPNKQNKEQMSINSYYLKDLKNSNFLIINDFLWGSLVLKSFKKSKRSSRALDKDIKFLNLIKKNLKKEAVFLWSLIAFQKTIIATFFKEENKKRTNPLDIMSSSLLTTNSKKVIHHEKKAKVKQKMSSILKSCYLETRHNHGYRDSGVTNGQENKKQLGFLFTTKITKHLCISLPKHSDLLLINHYFIKLEKSPYNFVDTQYWFSLLPSFSQLPDT